MSIKWILVTIAVLLVFSLYLLSIFGRHKIAALRRPIHLNRNKPHPTLQRLSYADTPTSVLEMHPFEPEFHVRPYGVEARTLPPLPALSNRDTPLKLLTRDLQVSEHRRRAPVFSDNRGDYGYHERPPGVLGASVPGNQVQSQLPPDI